jgi:putative hemolysin
MVEQVFRLDDAPVKAIMTPRMDVIWLDLDDPAEEVCSVVATAGHSRYPVARGDLDQMLGLVYAKDMLAAGLEGRPLDLEAWLRPALFLPESITALEAVERLKENGTDAALILDEYGGLEGLLTADDILRAIVGEIPAPGGTAEPGAVQREDGSWLLDGMLPVEKVKELLGVDSLPHEGSDYHTLGGLAMLCLERIPSPGDRFECCGWQPEVVDMDGRRVDKILAVSQGQAAQQS